MTGGHFESSNMAVPLKICFGSRQIWIEHIKKYQCTKFHTFRPICTIAPLTDRTIIKFVEEIGRSLALPWISDSIDALRFSKLRHLKGHIIRPHFAPFTFPKIRGRMGTMSESKQRPIMGVARASCLICCSTSKLEKATGLRNRSSPP